MLKLQLQMFARSKNARREHFIAAFADQKPGDEDPKWKKIGKWIHESNNENAEETEEYADFAGDGTKQNEVIGLTIGRSFKGYFDREQESHKMIHDMVEKYEGNARKVWYKVKEPNGKVTVGIATISDIKIGSGEASDYEDIEFKVTYDKIPEITPAG